LTDDEAFRIMGDPEATEDEKNRAADAVINNALARTLGRF
jgi:hypothetical protein